MDTLAAIANSTPVKQRSKLKLNLPSINIPKPKLGTLAASLRLAAIVSVPVAGVFAYDAMRSFEQFQALENNIGISLAIPAMLAVTKIVNGLDFWRTSKPEVLGLLGSVPLSMMLLSIVDAGGVHGASLMSELAGYVGNVGAIGLVGLLQGALLAPFAPNLIKIADMLGSVLAALDWRKQQAIEPKIDAVAVDMPTPVITMPIVKQEPKTDIKRALLRDWLDDNGLQGVEIVDLQEGNSVDTFELANVKAKTLQEQAQDISRAFYGESVRVIGAIKGRNTIGLEISRKDRSFVDWQDIRDSKAFGDVIDKGGLPVVIGMDKAGNDAVYDLRELFHLLIAGRTGAGKSVGLNAVICGLAQLPHDQLKMLMIDPKKVELSVYSGLPHLITQPLTELDQAIDALNKMCQHMENRYTAFLKAGARNLGEYNEILKAKGDKPLPYIVIIVDEYGDLMLEDEANKRKDKDEDDARLGIRQAIQRLAQKARAAGMHLILATQRPDAKVFDGLIKANIPSRLCYQVADGINSRIVLDTKGAESLLDKGDCLLKTPASQDLTRIQGANITTKQVISIVKQLGVK